MQRDALPGGTAVTCFLPALFSIGLVSTILVISQALDKLAQVHDLPGALHPVSTITHILTLSPLRLLAPSALLLSEYSKQIISLVVFVKQNS